MIGGCDQLPDLGEAQLAAIGAFGGDSWGEAEIHDCKQERAKEGVVRLIERTVDENLTSRPSPAFGHGRERAGSMRVAIRGRMALTCAGTLPLNRPIAPVNVEFRALSTAYTAPVIHRLPFRVEAPRRPI